ncbi:MAG: hypothetical protein IKC93_08990, partial [Candidatus Methanomethylophilaceae archaeon]|nr:hypothetical protein [Candidatus Methanomethylophilaceae archaeon]
MNKQRGLLAAIMALVMVFAGAAFVAAEVDAVVDSTDVAKIGDEGFETLKDAIAAANENSEIELLKDATLDTIYDGAGIYQWIGNNVPITINGNGNKLSFNPANTTVHVSDDITFKNIVIVPQTNDQYLSIGNNTVVFEKVTWDSNGYQ